MANKEDHQLAGDVLLCMPTVMPIEEPLAASRQWDTVPVCSSSAGEAPGIAVVQELLEFKKALEGSKVNHPPALHFVGSALQLCS